MAKLPSFQFYPADWQQNNNLGECSLAAKGAWIEVLCILHDCDEYGVYRKPLSKLAKLSHVPMKILDELVENNVLKGSDKGLPDGFVFTPRHSGRDGEPVVLIGPCADAVWFSSRMVVDAHKRKVRGVASRFDEANQPNPPIGKNQTPPLVQPLVQENISPHPPKNNGSSSSSSSSVLIPITTSTTRGPSLTGITLDENQQRASDTIFAAAADRMRPFGPAGENWVPPLRMAEKIASAVDSMLKSGPAIIDGQAREPWEFAGEISGVIAASDPPAGLGPLCGFIPSIWDRCQRSKCRPGDPHRSTSLKIDRQKPQDTSEMDAAMAQVQIEIEKQEARRARR